MTNMDSYRERLKRMGLQPFEKYGFMYHMRKEGLDLIDNFPKIAEYKVSDFKGIKLYNPSKTDVEYFEPLLIFAEDKYVYYVFNGYTTYSLPKAIYTHYEIYDKRFDYSREDGFI